MPGDLTVVHTACSSLEEVPHLDCYFANNFKAQKVKFMSHVPGALRRPPSEIDLDIFSLAPNTVSFGQMERPLNRVDVPEVPGTFLMQNVLTNEECLQLISVAEAIGYSHDAVAGIDNIVLFADDSILVPIFQRCRHLLPQKGLRGINSRFRFFRYRKGAVYRPHIGEIKGNFGVLAASEMPLLDADI